MNGAHDLGGMHGFGPIDPERNEPVFHEEWEKRAFAITLACGALGTWNLDMTRYARERMDPAEYLRTSYYEHWLHGLELLLIESGLLTAEEINAREAEITKESGP
jgi:nitrile hydratase beta subunit